MAARTHGLPNAKTQRERSLANDAHPPAPTERDGEALQARHNRKSHHALGPQARNGKATPADFVSTFADGQAANTVAPPRPGAVKLPPVAKGRKPKVPAPVVMPALFTRRGRLIVPAALKGSHEILLRQNQMADHDGLDRVQDDADLDRLRGTKLLIAIPSGHGIQTDDRLPSNRRYCRPWTAQFLLDLAKAHYARFGTRLQVNSAVRTVEFQQRLLRTNGNAAPAEGETASPHLTGQAVDLAKRGLSLTEIAWLRGYLLPLVQGGKMDVEEEFQQACFHISVYKSYMPETAPKRVSAPARTGLSAVLATAGHSSLPALVGAEP